MAAWWMASACERKTGRLVNMYWTRRFLPTHSSIKRCPSFAALSAMVTYALPRRQRKQYPTHCKEHDIPSLSQRFHNGGTSTCCAAKDEGALAIEPRRGGGLAGVDADVGVGVRVEAIGLRTRRVGSIHDVGDCNRSATAATAAAAAAAAARRRSTEQSRRCRRD
ncbi:hypothetical protein IWZ03DRAFT_383810 [Phyllosticta citriasiana]|uniref:Uncharacterized protein n=1 Tax=Phyllosticta citriasiana TaxID=595635 RepID=A0ABR1KD38_9PEZI